MCYALSGWGKETSSGSSRSETSEVPRATASRAQHTSISIRAPVGEEYLQDDAHIHWSPSANRIDDLRPTGLVSYVDLPPPGKSWKRSTASEADETKSASLEEAV